MCEGLEAIERDFESFPNGHRNRIILVSDYAMYDDDTQKSKAILDRFSAKPHSKVICLDMGGYGDSPITKKYGRQAIDDIAELPDVFIESYIEDHK